MSSLGLLSWIWSVLTLWAASNLSNDAPRKFATVSSFPIMGSPTALNYCRRVAAHQRTIHDDTQWREPTYSRWSSGPRSRMILRSSSSENTPPKFLEPQEIYMISWEGCIADTVAWRIHEGYKAALATWPDLKLLSSIVDHDVTTEGTTSNVPVWLYNKVEALSHVLFVPTSNYYGDEESCCLTCEYAVLIRLLLEEQELDRGRSVGKTGKYASRFHPQQQRERGFEEEDGEASAISSSRREGRKQQQRSQGSRPLTVGEISVNWCDTIRETLMVRYRNPLKPLQDSVDRALLEQQQQQQQEMATAATEEQKAGPRLDRGVMAAINEAFHFCDNRRILILTVGHSSDLRIAESTLRAASVDYRIADTVGQALREENGKLSERKRRLVLMVQQPSAVEAVLKGAPKSVSSVHVVESSLPRLLQNVHLFGDYIPRMGSGGLAKCCVPGRMLALLCSTADEDWATRQHPNHQGAATMNPWIHTLCLNEFLERLSARIVPTGQ